MNPRNMMLASAAVLATAIAGTANSGDGGSLIRPSNCDENCADLRSRRDRSTPSFVWNYFGTSGADHFDPNPDFANQHFKDPLPTLPERLASVFAAGTLDENDTVVGLHFLPVSRSGSRMVPL